ncbi:MAG: polysaccharide pyruvyl transferase family protein [Clostridiales bacterium]|jgi:hypothetical protein|nr:polysaccharide pyruvyl transferase family protein [Clostridiales bacterium]
MRNILFSTTRQWNVGDEFILFGVINLMKIALPEGFNAIIYNRHPDLRTDMEPQNGLRNVKLNMANSQSFLADANFRIGLRDNSFKLNTDGQFIDLVVFAGTPEWSNSRCFDLYEVIEKYNLPVIALGIGNKVQDNCALILRNLDRFKLFTVRAPEFVELLHEYVESPQYLPCPSICSSPAEKIRMIEAATHIGLIYSCDNVRSEINNCVTAETYNYLLALYRELIHRYSVFTFSLICHYIDEMPFAYSDFPGTEILYSFDGKDYHDIYNRFDIVIGARVHGIGCAASMGIPGVCVMHDFRGETVKGFLAETINTGQSLESALETFGRSISTVSAKNKRLIEHIDKTRERYVALIQETLDLPEKSFKNYLPSLLLPVDDIFDVRPYLAEAARELQGGVNPKVTAAVAERDNAIAERDNAVTERDNAVTERDNAVTERDNAVTERDNAIAERNNAVTERDNAIAERNNAVAERMYVYASTSWKITAPLRAIIDFFKDIIRRNKK